jgi:hypothetical protein
MPGGRGIGTCRKESPTRRISRTLGCVLIALVASASLAACRDAVTGEGGNDEFSPTVVNLEATSGVSGANPTGTVHFHFGGSTGPDWHGEVSCLSVRGNTAIIGFGEGYFTEASLSEGLFRTYWVTGLIRIVDNGPGPGDTVEYVELQAGETEDHPPPPTGDPLPGPSACSTFPSDQQVYDLTLGPGFRVNDALPLRAPRD